MGLSRTKTLVTWLTSTSNGAGSTTSGSTVDLTGFDGAFILGTFTNGTAPTIGVTQVVQTSNDNGVTWDDTWQETAPTTASTTGTFQPVFIPKEIMYARVQCRGNTGQAVTCAARGSKTVYS